MTGSAAAPRLTPLVAGRRRPSASESTVRTSPVDDRPLVQVPVGDAADVDVAVAAARAAAPGWAATAPAERAARLKAAARRLRDHVDSLARANATEAGKPLADARGGVQAGIAAVEQYAELGPLHASRSLAGGGGATDLMLREPRGVAAVITPWNDPVAIAAQNLAACLVAGNTVVFKPSERTPATGDRLAELIAAELPPGVLDLVHGDGRAGRPLAAHPEVDVVVFVGSVTAGREIAAATARTGAHAVLELGGKDPLVVDAGVDPAWAAGQAALGAFANAGQICTAVERVYVHADLAEPFLAALVERARALVVGDPLDPATTMGPLVDRRHRDAVHAQVSAALAAGARALTGAAVPGGAGAFYPPTVLVDVTDAMAVMSEETFGPVAPVAVVESFDAGLERAAASAYGLAATVLTADFAAAQRALRQLPVGTVKVNAVFGGAPGGAAQPRRGSGSGFGYGPELLEEVTTVKVVHLAPPG